VAVPGEEALGGSLGVAGALERLARHLDRMRSRALAAYGLTPRDVEVLNALGRSGPPYRLSQGELAQAAQLSSGGMTGQADRMESAGWVQRSHDPNDRRGVLLMLTESGRGVLARSLAAYLADADATLADLDPADLDRLAELLAKLLASLGDDQPSANRAPGSGPHPRLGRERKALRGETPRGTS